MKIFVTYRMGRLIECDNVEDAVSQFEDCDLNDGKSKFIEVVSAEDCETFEDLTKKF